MQENRNVEMVGRVAAQLSVIELALGSLLHSLHIPFAGSFLSLNQGYFLCTSALEEHENAALRTQQISNVAAVLKSFSPAGKKLGPMVSLSMQGLLFSLGLGIVGVNAIGLALGMILLALWSFIQPLITYYLFFGKELFEGLNSLYQKTLPFHGIQPKFLGLIFLSVILAKFVMALFVVFLAMKRRHAWENWVIQLSEQHQRPLPTKNQGLALSLLRDITRPLFLLSLAITAFFLYFSEHSLAAKMWLLLRPVAIGLVFFYLSRTLTLERWLKKLHGTRSESFAKSCEWALLEIRKKLVL